jgi:hypothetical protein
MRFVNKSHGTFQDWQWKKHHFTEMTQDGFESPEHGKLIHEGARVTAFYKDGTSKQINIPLAECLSPHDISIIDKILNANNFEELCEELWFNEIDKKGIISFIRKGKSFNYMKTHLAIRFLRRMYPKFCCQDMSHYRFDKVTNEEIKMTDINVLHPKIFKSYTGLQYYDIDINYFRKYLRKCAKLAYRNKFNTKIDSIPMDIQNDEEEIERLQSRVNQMKVFLFLVEK